MNSLYVFNSHTDAHFTINIFDPTILLMSLDEESLYYLRDHLTSPECLDDVVRVLKEGRRLGYMDAKFENTPEVFTDNQQKLYNVAVERLKVFVFRLLSLSFLLSSCLALSLSLSLPLILSFSLTIPLFSSPKLYKTKFLFTLNQHKENLVDVMPDFLSHIISSHLSLFTVYRSPNTQHFPVTGAT